MNPSILLYEPQADGSLVLVGVENLVFEKAWRAAGNTKPPSFAGRSWDYMKNDPNTPGDEAHGFRHLGEAFPELGFIVVGNGREIERRFRLGVRSDGCAE